MKEPIRDPEVLDRMAVTMDLFQAAVDIMRQNLRRRHPDADEAEIERRLQEWMLQRPEDPPGTPLRVVDRARRPRCADFQIVAATWPGGRVPVSGALGGLADTQMRRLELLPRDEIVQVYRQAGVEVNDDVMRELVDQAADKPGLAVTIAYFLLAWVGELHVPPEEFLRRRQLIARAALKFLAAGGARAVGIHAICIALSPLLEGYSSDPGLGRTTTYTRAVVPDQCLAGITDLWEETRGAITDIDAETWPHLNRVLSEWIDEEGRVPLAAQQSLERIQSFAKKMVEDLMPLAAHSPGLSAGLQPYATHLGLALPFHPDPVFKILYPDTPDQKAQNEAARALGREWAKARPTEIAAQVRRYESEAQKVGLTWPRQTPSVCEEIAASVGEPEAWSAVFFEQSLPADLLQPFLERTARSRRAGWESQVERCFARREYRQLAAQLVLQLPSPQNLYWPRPSPMLKSSLSSSKLFATGGRVDLPVLRKLLENTNWELALAAGIGEWLADPRGKIRPELQGVWRRALVRARTESSEGSQPPAQSLQYWLKEVLKSDPELAFEWLVERVSSPVRRTSFLSAEPAPVVAAVSVLAREQRLGILEQLREEPDPIRFIALLVGRDPDLYARLLALPRLGRYQLVPLYGEVDERWAELAALAVKAGHSHKAVAERSCSVGQAGPLFSSSTMLDFWCKRERDFARFNDDPRPEVRGVAREGRRLAAEAVQAAEGRERDMALKGIR